MSLCSDIDRKTKLVTFKCELQSAVVCISDDSDYEELTPTKLRRLGVELIGRTSVSHDSFFLTEMLTQI